MASCWNTQPVAGMDDSRSAHAFWQERCNKEMALPRTALHATYIRPAQKIRATPLLVPATKQPALKLSRPPERFYAGSPLEDPLRAQVGPVSVRGSVKPDQFELTNKMSTMAEPWSNGHLSNNPHGIGNHQRRIIAPSAGHLATWQIPASTSMMHMYRDRDETDLIATQKAAPSPRTPRSSRNPPAFAPPRSAYEFGEALNPWPPSRQVYTRGRETTLLDTSSKPSRWSESAFSHGQAPARKIFGGMVPAAAFAQP